MKLQEIGTRPTTHRLNRIYESRFGISIDYNKLDINKALRLSDALQENLDAIRRSYGAHTAEKNPKYLEMLMVREGLTQWINENHEQMLYESEMGKSEAILAAKDIVDTIQDMMEDIGKIQNERLPALMDTIRDQVGSEQAEQFKNSITPLLQDLYTNIQQTREGADNAARALAGEQVAQPMGMGGDMGGMDGSMNGGMAPVPPAGDESDLDADEFAATDAAAGGEASLGRDKR